MNLEIIAITSSIAGAVLSLTIAHFARLKVGKDDMRLRYEDSKGDERLIVVRDDVRREQIRAFIDSLEHQ